MDAICGPCGGAHTEQWARPSSCAYHFRIVMDLLLKILGTKQGDMDKVMIDLYVVNTCYVVNLILVIGWYVGQNISVAL